MTALFVAFEGIDDCGKSTQARRVADAAGAHFTFEPGDTALGATLRERLLDASQPMTPETEALLMLADRAHHVASVIAPRVERGERVVTDRFLGSTLAYQGSGRGVDLEILERATELAVGSYRPDLTLLIDIPVDVAHSRRTPDRRDRFEAAGIEFHERVRAGFLTLAQRHDNWVVIDGARDRAAVDASVDDALRTIGW